mgnify:CR=1 FL=1
MNNAKHSLTAESISGDLTLSKAFELVCIHQVPEQLVVTLETEEKAEQIDVVFGFVAGLRVLDESDLNEYWPTCSTLNGWIYEIYSGGWFDQEKKREGFFSGVARSDLREFFIASDSDCMNILSISKPKLVKRNKAEPAGAGQPM